MTIATSQKTLSIDGQQKKIQKEADSRAR